VVKLAAQNRRLRIVENGSTEATSRRPNTVPTESGETPIPTADDLAPPSRQASRLLEGLDDAQVVALGLRGNAAAFETLYRRHAAFALHLAVRIAGTTQDAEDVVHDAFIKSFEKLRELADGALFKAWLGSIVVHAVRTRMRRTRLMKVLGLSGGETVEIDAVASASASPLVRAQLAQVYALLQTLPTDERIAWTLRAVEGHELEMVAQLSRCSLATAKRRISRAQQWLDAHFVEAHSPQEES
jgi:RNA polymerase sigma-70 factor, ECF subfamily